MFLLLACGPAEIEMDPLKDDPADSGIAADTASETIPPAPAAEVAARLNETVASVVYVSWTQQGAATAWVEYSVDPGTWRSTPPRALEAGAQEAIVLGVPYATELRYRVVLSDGVEEVASENAAITTGPLPEGLPAVKATTGEATLWDAATEYVLVGMSGEGEDFDGDWWTFILDRQGRVVWAMPTPYGFVSLYPRVASDGKALLVDYNSYWGQFDGGDLSQVARTRLDGTVETVWDTPGLHHAYTQLPDGTLAWGFQDRGEETLEELAPDGTRTTIWHCKSFLEGLGQRAACGSNTLYYDALTDHFLFSFYSTDTVVEVDRQSGEAVRWFGDVPGSWTFDPPESQFWWQHGPNLTADGTLLVSTHMTERGEEATVVREYSFDEQNQALHQVWSFGTEDDDQVWGEQMGEAWRLPGGNTLHNYGTTPRLREATAEGTVVWNVVWRSQYTLGRSTPLGDIYALSP